MTTATRPSKILDPDGQPFEVASPRYESHPSWGTGSRHWEAAESTRLNTAHWTYAQDDGINLWLAKDLPTLRARSIFESRQNAMVSGVLRTHADDIVGPEGPTLQVQSDDEAYNKAAEWVWQKWFAAPTMRPNVSGAAWLKLSIHNLWRCGELLDRIFTDPDADGPVAMRLWPVHPRRLVSPVELTGQPNVVMGIRFDAFGRPATYYIRDVAMNGQAVSALTTTPWPPDLMLHEFLVDEEDQARGFPWLTPGLNPTADLRDYDDQVLDAARQQADQSALLYTEHNDATLWEAPESMEVQRRTISMAPPGWKPWQYQATQPTVRHSEYRAEKHREIGRPVGMPLLMIRLDAAKHNYSSARLDTQNYQIAIAGIQSWLSGGEQSYGTLNRLVDIVLAEARFSIPELRQTPRRVKYHWTWTKRPHVDPLKEALAEKVRLESPTLTLTDALAAHSQSFETFVETLKRELEYFKANGLPVPKWLVAASSTNDALAELLMQYALDEEPVNATND